MESLSHGPVIGDRYNTLSDSLSTQDVWYTFFCCLLLISVVINNMVKRRCSLLHDKCAVENRTYRFYHHIDLYI